MFGGRGVELGDPKPYALLILSDPESHGLAAGLRHEP